MKTPRNDVTTRACVRMAALVAICVALAGCGGGGGGGGSSDNGPPPPVNGPAWGGFGRDAQHSALGGIATQALARLLWNTPVDQAPQYTQNGALLIHYGSPVISAHNTVIVPVRTASGIARIEARAGASGALLWSADSDYVLPASSPGAWTPSYGIALTPGNRVYFAADGKIFYRDDADNPIGSVKSVKVPNFSAPIFSNINAALTVDAAGTLFFRLCSRTPLERLQQHGSHDNRHHDDGCQHGCAGAAHPRWRIYQLSCGKFRSGAVARRHHALRGHQRQQR